MTRRLLALLLAAVALAPLAGASARTITPADYLANAQNSDGGFGASPGQPSASLFTGWAALGLAARGRSPGTVLRSGLSPIDFLRSDQSELQSAGDLERTILVLGAAGLSPRDFAGRDLVSELLASRRANGSIAGQANLTAFGILALRTSDRPPSDTTVQAAARWLRAQQNSDGGFGYATRGSATDIDDTGAVLQALAAARKLTRSTRARALRFLRRQQNRDGGFPASPGGDSNAQSTAFAVQGLIAAHIRVSSLRRHHHSPTAYLRSLIRPNGSVRYSRTSNQTPVWVTGQALLALAGKSLPLSTTGSLALAPAISGAGARTRFRTISMAARCVARERTRQPVSCSPRAQHPLPTWHSVRGDAAVTIGLTERGVR